MSLHTGLDQIREPEMPHFAIGGIIGRSLWITVWNFFPFILMTIVLALPLVAYGAALAYLRPELRAEFQNALAYRQLTPPQDMTGIAIDAVFLLLLLFALLGPVAAIVQRAFQSMLGRKAGFENCITLAVAASLRVVVLGILLIGAHAIVAAVIGWIAVRIAAPSFAFVPTFIVILLALAATLFLSAVWWVAFPVLMVEWTGPFAALRRSWSLTRGRRWQIVAILVLLAIPYAILQALLARYLPNVMSAAGNDILRYGMVVLSGLLGAFFYFAGAVAAAVGYFHLAGEKEGILALDRVFP
jgi:hypothetical protein